MTFKIEFHSIEKHIINKGNMQDYSLRLPEMMKNPLYLIEFHLTEDELTELFKLMDFVRTEDHSYTYTNNRGCNVLLNFQIVDCKLKDYFIFYEVKFIQNTNYPEGYTVNYNQAGVPIRVVFHNKNILKGLRLMSINYEIDQQNLQIAKISYRFDDGRKYQKAIKGFIYTIIETVSKNMIKSDH